MPLRAVVAALLLLLVVAGLVACQTEDVVLVPVPDQQVLHDAAVAIDAASGNDAPP